jgi:hypothetical protein
MAEGYVPTKVLRYRNVAEMVAAFPAPRDHYHAHGVVLLEDSGLDFDTEFVSRLVFPPEWKKYGTDHGLTVPPIVWAQGAFRRTRNPLCQLIREDWMLMKTYAELIRIELGFKLLVTDLFPTYRNIDWRRTTFRFTQTDTEHVHVDSFSDGKPSAPFKQRPRLKFFLNVDTQPRVWNVGPTLADLLKHSAGAFGPSLPADVNMVCHRVNGSDVIANAPRELVEIPPRGVIFANGATVIHQVVFGRRMVCVEGFVPRECVADCEWDHIREWIESAGYRAVAAEEAVTA